MKMKMSHVQSLRTTSSRATIESCGGSEHTFAFIERLHARSYVF